MRRSEIGFSMAGDRLVSQYAPVRDGVFWHRLRGANEIPIGLPEVSAHAATSGNYLATLSGCMNQPTQTFGLQEPSNANPFGLHLPTLRPHHHSPNPNGFADSSRGLIPPGCQNIRRRAPASFKQCADRRSVFRWPAIGWFPNTPRLGTAFSGTAFGVQMKF